MEIIAALRPVQNNIRTILFFSPNYACTTLVSDFIFLLKVHWLRSQNNEVHSLALIDGYYNKVALT